MSTIPTNEVENFEAQFDCGEAEHFGPHWHRDISVHHTGNISYSYQNHHNYSWGHDNVHCHNPSTIPDPECEPNLSTHQPVGMSYPYTSAQSYHDNYAIHDWPSLSSEPESMEAYSSRDVLCGRGALMAWHPGNQAFRALVKSHREMYLFARRREKPRIANYVIDVIHSSGGRFLRESELADGVNQQTVWVDIGYEKAYEKTCQALREGAPKMREKWRLEQENSEN